MCAEEIIPLAKDVIVTIAAAVGAYVAVQGLNTWNRQLKGSAEYDLARRILKLTYRYREAIKKVRNPTMLASEMPCPPEKESTSMTPDKRHFYGLSYAYDTRWQTIRDIRSDFETELLEAEVLWGPELQRKYDAIFKLEFELFRSIRDYLRVCNPDVTEMMKKSINERLRKQRDIMYDSLEEDDVFNKDISGAIRLIEDYLKPHLRR